MCSSLIFCLQIIASVDDAKDILSQVEEITVPIIVFTLENKLIGRYRRCPKSYNPLLTFV